MQRHFPRTMSTQHPDNVSLPTWADGSIIQGEAEVDEAYFAYNTLGCMEVMWDSEGKDVDTRVVRKLLNKYGSFFKEKVLGEDVYLTYRVPNPRVETAEHKILLESLINIPVACDIATTFYKRDVSPIFEVILPFTTSGEDLIFLKKYYETAVAGAEKLNLDRSFTVEDWLGSFNPKTIEVIPLIEDMPSILNIKEILTPYIKIVKPKHLRVFIARSDPAMNYGLVCSVLLCKIAFSQLKQLEKLANVKIHPILGVGTMPFRGHLAPNNLAYFMDEYKGVTTVTIQSALKYDYPTEEVRKTVNFLNEKLPSGEPPIIDNSEKEILSNLLVKFVEKYQSSVEKLANLVNAVAAYVPPRRARKLHIGLFGYSRSMGKVVLPRAITFAGAFYSLGIPPEFIGFRALESLNDAEWEALSTYYVNLRRDLETAGVFLSWRNINTLADLHSQVAKTVAVEKENLRLAITEIIRDLHVIEENFNVKLGPRDFAQKRYENAVNNFLIAFIEQNREEAQKCLLEAAKIRRCLG